MVALARFSLVRRVHVLLLLVAVGTSLVWPTGSHGATFTVNPGGKKTDGQPYDQDAVQAILIAGEIVPGDAERLIQAVFSRKKYRIPPSFILNSPGGSLSEALKMARVIHAMKARAGVYNHYALLDQETSPKPFICASSCFLLYVAAEQRSALAGYGRVGIHRPYFRQAPASGTSEVDELRKLFGQMDEVLKYFGVSSALIDKMRSLPSNDIYWLTQDDLYSLGYFSAPVEEIAVRECGFRRDLIGFFFGRTNDLPRSQFVDILTCVEDQFFSESQATMEKMRRGWRPY